MWCVPSLPPRDTDTRTALPKTLTHALPSPRHIHTHRPPSHTYTRTEEVPHAVKGQELETIEQEAGNPGEEGAGC